MVLSTAVLSHSVKMLVNFGLLATVHRVEFTCPKSTVQCAA